MRLVPSGRSRDQTLGYGVAVLAPVATAFLRLWLGSWLIGTPFILLFPSVTLAAFVGGLGPGILALAVCVLLSIFVLIEPRWSLTFAPEQALSIVVFVLVGGFQIWLVYLQRCSFDEHRRGHEQEHLRYRELQHRVGNLLQLMISMTRMQLRAESDPAARAAVETLSRRAEFLSQLNEHLQENEPAGSALLQEVTGKLLALSGAESVTCTITVEDGLAISMHQRQPIAFMVNELVVNALKHAFTPAAAGQITIHLARAEPGWTVLNYTDSGAPFPAGFTLERDARSGLKLVGSLARLLGGTLEIRHRRPKEIVIRFRLA